MATRSGGREKSGENWKTVYQGAANSCSLNPPTSALSQTRQLRVLVVLKYHGEEVQSTPSPIAVFNVQRAPTDSPRKRVIGGGAAAVAAAAASTSSGGTRATGGSSSTAASARSSSGSAVGGGRSVASTRALASNKLSVYKRFKRSLAWLKRSISERDGAFIVLVS